MFINKKTLEYLAELSRIELDKKYEEKMLSDLQKILEYFKELKEVNTENTEPTRLPPARLASQGEAGGSPEDEAFGGQVAGGTIGNNVFREDESSVKCQVSGAKLIEAFPEKENRFLKIPPVFG